MNDKKLIAKLQELRQIKPRKDWVFSLKKEILGEQPKFGTQISTVFEILPRIFFQRKLAYVVVTTFLIIVSIFGLSLIPTSNNNKFEAVLLSAANESRNSLEIANQKLENLAEIAKTRNADKIVAAVNDANESIANASKTITKDIVSNSKALKEIAASVKKIDQNRNYLQTLGVTVDSDYQLNNVLQPLVQREIESLEKSTLSENQQLTLKEIKGLYDQGQYADALEKILLTTNPN